MIAKLDSQEPDSDALTAAILLGSYEAMAASSTSHQSHYKGAMNLIITRGVSASSVGLDKVNFFIYMRHEITIALSDENSLQSDPKIWNIRKPGPRAGADHLANYLMMLIGLIVNTTYKRDVSRSDRKSLKDQIREWYDNTTEEFRGVAYGDILKDGTQKVFFPFPNSGELESISPSSDLTLTMG